MRIISGRLKGKTLKTPKGPKTHPMSEKIRGAIFNALGDIEGLSVLDAYGGSGALSFEALSRGASSAVIIDIDNQAVNTIKLNAKYLGLNDVAKVIKANATGWSNNNPNVRFDLVLADPPFNDVKPSALSIMAKHLKMTGVFCLNWPGKSNLPDIENLEIVTDKQYGDARLGFYKYKTKATG